MKVDDFRFSMRLLRKEVNHSALTLLGLSLGFAVFMLLISIVLHAFSYDKHVPDVDNVYVVKTHFNFAGSSNYWSDTTPLVVRDEILQSGMASNVVRLLRRDIPVRAENKVFSLPLTMVDPDFETVFGVNVLEGNLAQALSRPDALALTRGTVTKLFGDEQALGKTVLIAGRTFQVQAVIDNPPSATTVPYVMLAGIDSAAWSAEEREAMVSLWTKVAGKIYLKMQPGVTVDSLERLLEDRSNASPLRAAYPTDSLNKLGDKNLLDFRLGSLGDAYFDPDIAAVADPSVHGNHSVVLGLAFVACMILVMSAANYVSLATVRTVRRQREIGMRKILGAKANQIMVQFIIESICFTLFAVILGFVLAMIALPVFSDLVNRQLDQVFTPVYLLFGLFIAVLVGGLAGLYPAWLAMRVPGRQLADRRSGESSGGMLLRRTLTVVQFAAAVGLTGLTLAVAWQTQHASRVSPGFDPTPLFVLKMKGTISEPENRTFAQTLKRIPGIEGVAATTGVIGQNQKVFLAYIMREGQQQSVIELTGITVNFFEVYGIEPIAGRVFDERIDNEDKDGMLVINKASVTMLGFESPSDAVGKFVLYGSKKEPKQIIGVIDNVRDQSVRENVSPMLYLPHPRAAVLTIRAPGDSTQIQEAIAQQWNRDFPDYALELDSLKAKIVSNYADDLRLSWLLLVATMVIGIISSLGIYVLSAYNLQRRVREIALRKLFGAKRLGIARLVGKEVLLMVVLSAVIGLPFAAFGTAQYMANFVERAPVEVASLVIAFLVSAVVAFAATLHTTLSALRVAPARALRD